MKFLFAEICAASCSLDRRPTDDISRDVHFKTEATNETGKDLEDLLLLSTSKLESYQQQHAE